MAILLDAFVQCDPGLLYHWEVGRLVENSIVDPPGNGIAVETRTAHFATRIGIRIKQAGTPETIGLLQLL